MIEYEAWTTRINDAIQAAIRAAAAHGATLDYSEESVTHLERLISSWESTIRVANDHDGAYVGDQLGGLVDVLALGTYYGEMFVRFGGAAWGEADREDGPEPAVTRGGVTIHPLDIVRRRVSDGRHVDLARIFQNEKADRARIAGGWPVFLETPGRGGLGGVTFYPDPDHTWDGEPRRVV